MGLTPLRPRSIVSVKTGFASNLSEEEMKAFTYPEMSAKAEIDSFNLQSVKFNQTSPPSAIEIAKVLDRMEAFYSKSKWTVREDFCSDQHIDDTIEDIMKINHSKNPGAILTRKGYLSNKMVLEALGLSGIRDMVRDRIEKLLKSDDTRYVSDPIRIFEKPEAHKMAKAALKRWRLIWGVSLIDQVIDRILYTPVCEASLKNSADQAAKPGYNFKSGGIHRMVKRHEQQLKPWYSFDASSFDFTVAGWQLDINRDLNERLCITQGPLREKWSILSKKREEAVKYGSFAFSNGQVFRQLLPGLQKSGRYTTIDGNCKVTIANRVLYDIRNDLPSNPDGMEVMGDDQVAYDIISAEDYTEFVKTVCGNYLTLECPAGPFVKQNFCSTEVYKTKDGIYAALPSNYGKCSWTLANMQKEKMETYAEALTGYCIEYVFHPNWVLFYDELLRVAPAKARSKDYYEAIHLRME